ncbi:hypothetical protein GGS26DRAFT_554257 [Hypomontagnella submonticulosa]|nr:hypothetical protein GGS26DRAFT_554257 [Hypomontagnella submonticulosa]
MPIGYPPGLFTPLHPTQPSPAASFPLFGKLPLDIAFRIWRYCHDSMAICIEQRLRLPNANGDPFSIPWSWAQYSIRIQHQRFGLMYACDQSRAAVPQLEDLHGTILPCTCHVGLTESIPHPLICNDFFVDWERDLVVMPQSNYSQHHAPPRKPVIYTPNIPLQKIQNILLVFGSKRETSLALDWLGWNIRALRSLKTVTLLDVASFLDFQNEMTKQERYALDPSVIDILLDKNRPDFIFPDHFLPGADDKVGLRSQVVDQPTGPETSTTTSRSTQQPRLRKLKQIPALRLRPTFECRNFFLDRKSSKVRVAIVPIGRPPNVPPSRRHVRNIKYDRSYVPIVLEWRYLISRCIAYRRRFNFIACGLYHDETKGTVCVPAAVDVNAIWGVGMPV